MAGIAMAALGIAALPVLDPRVGLAQTARPQQPATRNANGSAACFTATDPAAIITGCDAFLTAANRNTNVNQTGLALQRRGGARVALGQMDQAIADFRQMAASGYKVHEAQASIGSLEFHRRRFSEAEAAYREALRINPSYSLARVGLGHTLISLGRPADAIGQFDSALSTSDNDVSAHLGKGSALAATGDLDGAIRSFDAALRIDGQQLHALYQRAQANNDKRDNAAALADVDRIVSIATGNERIRARVYRGRLHINARSFDAAITDCTAAEADAARESVTDPNLQAAIHVCLGLARQSKGELREALQGYERALTWNGTDVAALAGRGYIRLQRGQYDAAVEDFDAALRVDPKSQDALRFLGLAYADKGDRAKANEAFARAIAADARDPWPLMIRAIASARDGDRNQAQADVTQALAITGPQSSDALLVRGAVSYFLGAFDTARADIEASLRLNPDNGQAHRMLARLLIREGRLDDAQRSQDTAARLLPNDATVLLQDGLVALAHRDYVRAVRDLTNSLEVNDAHAEAFAARGQAHEGQGLVAAALADYRNAVAKLALDSDARAAVAMARERIAALTTAPPPATVPSPETSSEAPQPATPPHRQGDASLYCRLVEGVFVRSRKYTGVEFDIGCRP